MKTNTLHYNVLVSTVSVICAFFLDVPVASALSKIWYGTVSSDWNNSANWGLPGVPGSIDNVIISKKSKQPIIDANTHALHSLNVQSGELTIQNGGQLSVGALASISSATSASPSVLTVTGSGSLLSGNNSFNLSIGQTGFGTVNVYDGAQVSAGSIYLGGASIENSRSALNIVGQGSLVTAQFLAVGSGVMSGNVPTVYDNIVNIAGGGKLNAQNVLLGNGSKGIINITDGTATIANLTLAGAAEGQGYLYVDGSDALVHVSGIIYNGFAGANRHSEIVLQNGGRLVTDNSTMLGIQNGEGNSAVMVRSGAEWTSTGDTSIGFMGAGTLRIENQGKVQGNQTFIAASGAGSIADVFVSDVNSLLNYTNINIAGTGKALLTVQNGAHVTSENFSSSLVAGSYSSINVIGDGSILSASDSIILANGGKSDVIISDGGLLRSTQTIMLAAGNDSEANLIIGDGFHAGKIEAPAISGGDGTANIVLNHQKNINFDPVLTGRLNLMQRAAGITTLLAVSDYTGDTIVSAGVLRASKADVFSTNAHYKTTGTGALDLNSANQSINSLYNGGLVLLGTKTGTQLNVKGHYHGDGGIVVISTVLGDDNSPTDRLVVKGDTTGESKIFVHNKGGAGADTAEGIQIIQVDGQSAGEFKLIGNYTRRSVGVVVAGAHTYKLHQGSVSDPTNGHWYLRSETEDEGYQAGIPVYEAYPQFLLGLNNLPTMQQRVGNRYWNNAGNMVIAQGADGVEAYAPVQEAGNLTQTNGVWGRIEGAHTKMEPNTSTTDANYDFNAYKMQAGLDGMIYENEQGKLIAGGTVHYTHGLASVWSPYDADLGRGRIQTDGYGFGATLTWAGDDGFYVDNQVQLTWYRSDLSYAGGKSQLKDGKNNGFGYALSSEIGKRFALDQHWSLTPQAQLQYSNVDFSDFTDVFGADVSRKKGDSLRGRLGLSVDYQNSWQNAQGLTNRSSAYGIVNLYNEFLSGTKVRVSTEDFVNKSERFWGGIGLGGSYNWDNDKYSIYGEGSVNTSLQHFGDSYTYKGTVGLSVKW